MADQHLRSTQSFDGPNRSNDVAATQTNKPGFNVEVRRRPSSDTFNTLTAGQTAEQVSADGTEEAKTRSNIWLD